jgi:hypothetical protein
VPARGPCSGPRWGRRLGSRRAGCTPGRCAPARRCVIPPIVSEEIVPPPARAAILAAATRSRCPQCPQCGQLNVLPAGLGTRRVHAGQVEEVPRSSTKVTVIPLACALSDRARISCPTRQERTRWLCRRPASRPSTPRGSPTASVPTRCPTAQPMTILAAYAEPAAPAGDAGLRSSAAGGGTAATAATRAALAWVRAGRPHGRGLWPRVGADGTQRGWPAPTPEAFARLARPSRTGG